ncbi:unnamed protein product [Closterium sp. NIES-65]|nr:unnamed protein product [Closterium sp. NIES-65]
MQLEGSHTALLIAKTLEGILAEWGLTETLFAATTDNAENNNKAMRMLAGDPAEGAESKMASPLFDGDRHLREQLDGLRLTDVHWEALVELKEFLEPFNTITKAAEGSLYPTAASVVPLYNQLLDKLEISSRKEGVTPLRQALDSATLAKLKKFKYGEKEELVIATFLDPHYKIVFFQLPKWEARNAAHVTKVGGCARRVQDVDEETVIWLVHVRLAKY